MKETPSDKEIYKMERKGEEILADESMTEEREGSEMREAAAKNHLIEEIKEKGMEEGSEARKLWDRWILDQEAHMGAIDTSTADIESFRERAKVLYATGLLDEALDELEIALEQAFYEHTAGFYEEISDEMDKIENEIIDGTGVGEDE